MKISTKGRYGLRILVDLALHSGQNPRLMRDIAQSEQISEKYISRLVIALRRAGLVSSVRGAKGGLQIAKSPDRITLLEIVEAMEGTISIVDCVMAAEGCPRSAFCGTHGIWGQLNTDIRNLMGKITLEDIIKENRDIKCKVCPAISTSKKDQSPADDQ